MCPGSSQGAHWSLITWSENAHLPIFLSWSLPCFLHSTYLQIYTFTLLFHCYYLAPSARLKDPYGKVSVEPLHPQLSAQWVAYNRCSTNASWTLIHEAAGPKMQDIKSYDRINNPQVSAVLSHTDWENENGLKSIQVMRATKPWNKLKFKKGTRLRARKSEFQYQLFLYQCVTLGNYPILSASLFHIKWGNYTWSVTFSRLFDRTSYFIEHIKGVSHQHTIFPKLT